MKLLGVFLVVLCLLFGFICVFAACGAGWDLIHNKPDSIGDAIFNWCMTLIALVTGMACFACCPAILEDI